jgi:hypothetical protein
MASSGMLRRVALVRTDVSEEFSAPIFRVTRIGEIGTTLAVTSNRRTLRRNGNIPIEAILQAVMVSYNWAVQLKKNISSVVSASPTFF